MSDLKLYKGINNIDDDLIEEADCKQKPIIHHCYAIAASAAAIFIAAGATGFLHSSRPVRKPAPSDSAVVTEENEAATSAIYGNNSSTSAQTSNAATHCPSASTSTSVSNSKTSTAKAISHTETTAVSADTSQTEAGSQDSSDVRNYDFEYEGSIIMKQYAALLSSMLMLANGTSAQTQTYMPENEDIGLADQTKAYIEDNDIDIDFNCDGKIDIFDLYAFYRAKKTEERYTLVGSSKGTIPDYIMEKYNASKKEYYIDTTYTDSQTGEEKTFKNPITLDNYSFSSYFFTYCSDVKLEFFDPDFYINNCPDDYQDDFPFEFIKHDDKLPSLWDFQKTMYIKKESDGSYRFYNENDASEIASRVEDSPYEIKMRHMPDLKVSPIHEFIESIRYPAHDSGRDYPLMKEMVEKGYADPDVDSDGDFDMDDIIRIATFERRHSNAKENTFFKYLFEPETDIYHNYFDNEYFPHILSEDEWNKCFSFVDTAANYFNFYTGDIVRYLTQYYLTYNVPDPKYFDPLYYDENNYSKMNPHSCPDGLFFGYLGYYESFSLKYGPKNETSPSETENNFVFTEDEINAAFPVYYRKVKTGVLPKPDIDLDGKLTVADYNILYNLSFEGFSDYSNDNVSVMIRRHPELKVEIGISQEVRDNFNTNFDFNNNGLSGDSLEIDCMMMYILNDIRTQYNDEEEMNKAIDTFYAENPELQYYEIFIENIKKYNEARNTNLGGLGIIDETANISNSVEILKNYSSFANIETLPTGNGDANGDGKVDISDAVLIMQSLANPSKYGINGSDNNHITDDGFIRADVDGKGVTNMDALTIQKYLLGLTSIE